MTWYQRLGVALLIWATIWLKPGVTEKGIDEGIAMALIGTVLFVVTFE
jgi:hypothetical protein